MAEFRMKSIIFEAYQYPLAQESRGVREFLDWLSHHNLRFKYEEDVLIIETLDGDMRAHPGDWIIKGFGGDFHLCKPDTFEEVYEPVESGK